MEFFRKIYSIQTGLRVGDKCFRCGTEYINKKSLRVKF